MKREDIVDLSGNYDMLFLHEDEYDDCLIGWMENNELIPIAVYNVNSILEMYMNKWGMNEEEALEYFDFNLSSSNLVAYVWIYEEEEGVN